MTSGATSSLLDVVSHTPVETRLLGEAQAAFEWTDATRAFIPPEEKIYSWWSYRAAGLGSVGSRPPPGPCLAQSRPERRAQIPDHREKNARLAEGVGSCAGDRRDRSLKLALLRHGPTGWNAQGRIQGRTDIPLSDEGLAKMRELSPPAPFDKCAAFVSPSRRARQTAEAIGIAGRDLGSAADGAELGQLGRIEPGRYSGARRRRCISASRRGARVPAARRRIHRRTA